MAEAAALTAAPAAQVDRSFLWRRLHSLSGLFPIGAFLLFHIYENLAAVRGAAVYDEGVNELNQLLPRPYFLGVELVVLIVPILFHGLYGLFIAGTGKSNIGRYAYPSNWAYWLQRISGYVAFIYLIIHVGVLRVLVTLLGRHIASPQPVAEGALDLVTFNDVAAHLGNPAKELIVTGPLAGGHMFAIYLVGTLLSIWHFTNGLNGFAWTWGLAVGRVAQRRVRLFGWLLFTALTVANLNILFVMRFAR